MEKSRNKNIIKTKLINFLGNIFLILGIAFLSLAYGPLLYDELWYFLKTNKDQKLKINPNDSANTVKDSPFARLLSSKTIDIDPVNKDFSIVIERIGVNAPIKQNVSVGDKKSYNSALKEGIAHAISSNYPSKNPGNVYLFAHSSLNFWELGRYAKVFNLLRKMQIGDDIHIFYKNKDYIYEVVNKEKYNGWNTYPLKRTPIEPILTLQTCDPPGTTINRLVITAKLKKVLD